MQKSRPQSFDPQKEMSIVDGRKPHVVTEIFLHSQFTSTFQRHAQFSKNLRMGVQIFPDKGEFQLGANVRAGECKTPHDHTKILDIRDTSKSSFVSYCRYDNCQGAAYPGKFRIRSSCRIYHCGSYDFCCHPYCLLRTRLPLLFSCHTREYDRYSRYL